MRSNCWFRQTVFVDRVRLLSPPQQLAEMLVLAAAKTWQMEPARRNGRPAAYRLVVTWAGGVGL
jgi:hypothetical protein